MEIEYGATVKDKNGKVLGTVNRVMRDTWTGDISKFSVSTELAEADLFYDVGEVAETSSEEVKLNIAFGESETMGIQYGAEVLDKNGKLVGTVDYPVSDTLTGKITKFKVSSRGANEDIIFSVEDVDDATPSQVRLKIAFG